MLTKTVKTEILISYQNFTSNLQQNLLNDPGFLWHFVKTKGTVFRIHGKVFVGELSF